jgi:N-acetylglutamate synthase-like GNAT family acetyltransferase
MIASAEARPRPGVRTALPVVPAVPGDAPAIARALRRCAPETVAVPEDEIRRHWRRYLVVRAPGVGVVATAALHEREQGACELRSLAVEPRWRGCGLGARVVRSVIARVRRRGGPLLCVTLRPGFFERFGFRRLPPEAVPERRNRPPRVGGRPRVAMVRRPDTGLLPAASSSS